MGGVRGAAGVVVVAGLITGCSGPLTEPAARPSRFVEEPVVSAAARESYGPAAEQAYQELAAFVLDESLVVDLLEVPREEITAEQLNEGIRERFAPESRPGWEIRVGAALAGDAEAQADVQVLRLHDLQVPEGVGLATEDPVRSQVVTEAVTDVAQGSADEGGATTPPDDVDGGTAGADRPLTVAFRHRAVIALRGRGGRQDVELDRVLSFEVVQNTSTTEGYAWLIQSYEGDVTLTVADEELPLVDEATTTAGSGSG